MSAKKYRYVILTLVIVFFFGLAALCWEPILSFVADPESLRQWILETGPVGVLVFLLVRKFGMGFVELFISRKQIDSIHFLKNTQKLQSILFFIFLIPGTPKDVITYLAGLTELPLRSWIFICFVGRFPAILLTALSGSALGSARYGIVAAVIVVFAVFYLIGMRLYKRWNQEQ